MTPEGAARSSPPPPLLRIAGLLLAVAVLVVAGAQVSFARTLWSADPGAFFDASHAHRPIALNAVLALLTVVVAFVAPARWRWIAMLPGAATFAAVVGTSLTLGGHVWPAATALLTATAAWQLGRWTLVRLGASVRLHVIAVEVVLGSTVLGLVVLLVGRIGILAWWNVGALVVVLGLVGLSRAVQRGWARRRAGWDEVTASPMAVAAAGIIALTLAWAAVWLAAPDIMFDAVYGKAYLPKLWADTGSIGPLVLHPVLNIAGLSQVVAVPGHTLGAPDVGRWMQFLALPAFALTLWGFAGRRNPIGPLFAVAVVLVPHLLWQAATAFDDAILVLVGASVGLAVWRLLDTDDQERAETSNGTVLALGLLGGSAIWFKLHLGVLVVVALIGWLACTPAPRRRVPRRTLLLIVGGAIAAGPTMILRWIDTGNPLFPSYNDIFKSKYYPPVNEAFNFPFWPQGAGSWLRAPYEAVAHPDLMAEAAAPGSFGILVPLAVAAIVFGWYQRRRRVGIVLWAAVVLSLVFWWMQFRYLRYAMPTVAVGILLLEAQAARLRLGRVATGAALLFVAVLAAVSLPSTVAIFWNVPDRALPFAQVAGRWDDTDYLRRVYPEKDALAAFQRAAPPGAVAVGDAFQRTYLNDRDLSPAWEVAARLSLATGSRTVERLRSIGITWALMANSGEASKQLWLTDAMDRYGEPVFADRGFTLYRFTEKPTRRSTAGTCDPGFADGATCWGPGIDGNPGLAGAEVASRSVAACPGSLVGLRVQTGPGGQPSQVILDPDGATGLSGLTSTLVPPATARWVYVTVPEGAANVGMSVAPGQGATVVSARSTRSGPCSAPTADPR